MDARIGVGASGLIERMSDGMRSRRMWVALVTLLGTCLLSAVGHAQAFKCATQRGQALWCTKEPGDSVVCTADGPSGAIELSEVMSCVGEHFDTGPNPIVTLAAFGGASEPTHRNSDWNGGTAFTTHTFSALEEVLDGRLLHYELVYPMLDGTGEFVYPGQPTLVTVERVASRRDIKRLDASNTLLVAAGGGAHGRVIPGDAIEDAKRGGVGGYADGWNGRPCPYTANAVCADGTRGHSAKDAPGGAGGTEERNPPFVGALANGVADSFGDRFAWGGHGGAGHSTGGGGSALARLTHVSASGGGGGGSLALRSTRETPPTVEPRLLEEPGFQIFFHRDGLQTWLEWRYSEFTGEGFDTIEVKAVEGETSLSVTVNEPGAATTDIELGGLVLVERCSPTSRRIEPYKLTGLSNLGSRFTTDDDAVIYYRLYDGKNMLIGTGQTRAAASFTPNETLDLFFTYVDQNGNEGRLSIFATSGARGEARSHRICPAR